MTNYELEQELTRIKGVINRELDILLSKVKISKEEKSKTNTDSPNKMNDSKNGWVEMSSNQTNFPTIVM